MASRKRELYEILAEKNRAHSLESDSRLLPGEVESAAWREDSSIIASHGNVPLPETREYADSKKPEAVKSGELIIDFNTGMAALLIVLIMIGTAAYLGYQAGMRNEVNRLQARMQAEVKDIYAASASVEDGLREERSISLLWPADTYVLRLISFNMTDLEWTKTLDTLNYAKAQPVLEQTGLEAHIMADGEVYYVVIGPFKNRNDQQLKKVQDAFRTLKGPRTTTGYGLYPYESAYGVRFDKLGQVVE